MGVPALFRWLTKKYPSIVTTVVEEQPQELEGQVVPVDTTKPNPNGEEMDNLYLDMNGIVHPCSHPEDKPPPETEKEMMIEIFKYTERVVNMVRPRKILMIAVDGVAPRAKMNQQRSRRFRSAQEAKELDEQKAEFAKLLQSSKRQKTDGEAESEPVKPKKTWDSNVITPGTPFMDILAMSLRYWTAYKLNTDPAWAKLKVIISDATVPGEGEHKIMEFIRSQRQSPDHNPNTRHVMYGLDADLIMLGLATHEPHFRILREDVFFQDSKARTCRLCGQKGHFADQCKGKPKEKEGAHDEKSGAVVVKPYVWLHVSVLREYLNAELRVPNQDFQFDLERALDDWVFMCFFVGNDFLPHLPSLDIRENSIDTLITIWRDNLPAMGGYVTLDGDVNLERAQFILDGLAKQEDAIFRRRKQTEERRAEEDARRKEEDERRRGGRNHNNSVSNNGSPARGRGARHGGFVPSASDLPLFAPGNITKEARSLTHDMVVNRQANFQANKSAAAVLKSQLLGKTNNESAEEVSAPGNGESSPTSASKKRKVDQVEGDSSSTPGAGTPGTPSTPKTDALPEDTVKLWETGYADRYYEQKFKVSRTDVAFRNQVARDYVVGLAWVLKYYFQGCQSWTWYYPHHYAPFAADFVGLKDMKITFDNGAPAKPFEQLMGVLPAASRHAIPEIFHDLMTNKDSEIIDFYPEDFEVDLNGKKFAWQGVAILPFIDQQRLLDAMAKKYPLLSTEEHARNTKGQDVLQMSETHPLYSEVTANFYSKKQGGSRFSLDSKISDGLAGLVIKDNKVLPFNPLVFPLEDGSMPDLDSDNSISRVGVGEILADIPIEGTVVAAEDEDEAEIKAIMIQGSPIPQTTLSIRDTTGNNRPGDQFPHLLVEADLGVAHHLLPLLELLAISILIKGHQELLLHMVTLLCSNLIITIGMRVARTHIAEMETETRKTTIGGDNRLKLADQSTQDRDFFRM
ncbi:MAG: 5'-3' exoribonuclease 2 [Vezdaea aestivalis]|nr:MAG: 5'-3' exoribonuclease 2 [Vezdaea aestivalis]